MKRSIRIFLALMAVVLSTPSHLWAQELPSTESSFDIQQPSEQRVKGMGLHNVGKGFLYTGAAFTTAGIIGIFTELTLSYFAPPPSNDDMIMDDSWPVYAILGILSAAAGISITTIGLPIYFGGKYMMNKSGAPLRGNARPQKGWSVIIDSGLAADIQNSLHGIVGYNFGHNLFLGVGTGVDSHLFYLNNVPLYANLRLQIGDNRCAPYIGVRGGFELLNKEKFYGIDVGVRQQCKQAEGSWWYSASYSMGDNYTQDFFGIRVARSF